MSGQARYAYPNVIVGAAGRPGAASAAYCSGRTLELREVGDVLGLKTPPMIGRRIVYRMYLREALAETASGRAARAAALTTKGSAWAKRRRPNTHTLRAARSPSGGSGAAPYVQGFRRIPGATEPAAAGVGGREILLDSRVKGTGTRCLRSNLYNLLWDSSGG
jgi:hypothetical protein